MSLNKTTIGPDLNKSKPLLDEKLYRQILLPNGLRAILISDIPALKKISKQEKNNVDDDVVEVLDDASYDSAKILENDCDYIGSGDRYVEVLDDASIDSSKISENDCDESNDSGKVDDDCDGEYDDEDEILSEEDEGNGHEGGERRAAGAILVGAGSYHDPPNVPGLAHFLEHMVFMGNQKYPLENEFDEFLSKHGGDNNAYTEQEYTLYHFEIIQEYLGEALDRMANFFINPLLSPNAVERELNAIESEFQLSKNNDSCRYQEVLCVSSKKEHPFSKFSFGNKYSLQQRPKEMGVDALKELRDFYDMYYYSSNMRVVAIGAYTLDELQSFVEDSFCDIPSKPRINSPLDMVRHDPNTWDEKCISPLVQFGLPFDTTSLTKLYKIIPVKDVHTLTLTWQIPPQRTNWKTKPCDIIAHLLGHESQGSILSLLKTKHWATSCCAGVGGDGYEDAPSHSLFSITITLSCDVIQHNHWIDIVHIIFAYIGMIKYYCKEGLPSWIYQELKTIADLSYKYAHEKSPTDVVESLAETLSPLHNIPADRVLDGDSLLWEFDNDEVLALLEEFFIVDNCRFTLMSTSFRDENEELLHTEPYFGTQYWVDDVADDTLDSWRQASLPVLPSQVELALPPKNPFVPTNFDLKPLPLDDASHFLISKFVKLCGIDCDTTIHNNAIATVMKYNESNNQLLLSYGEDYRLEKWFSCDFLPSDEGRIVSSGGTFNNDSIQFQLPSSLDEMENGVNDIEDGTDDDSDNCDGNLAFPFIPPPAPKSHLPQLVHDSKFIKIWHKQDRQFRRPYAFLYLHLPTNKISLSPLHRACSDLLSLLVQDTLTDIVYLADVCELGQSISTLDYGFALKFYGFNDKLLELLDIVLKSFLTFGKGDGSIDRFESTLEVLVRYYSNSGMKASILCKDVRLRYLLPDILFSAFSKLNAIKNIAISKFLETISEILSDISIEGIYYGNCDDSDTKKAVDILSNHLSNSNDSSQVLDRSSIYPKVCIIPQTSNPTVLSTPTKDQKDANTAVEAYFQIGTDNAKERVMIDLLVQIMGEPFFDQLRTKEQYGYSVSCSAKWTLGVMGISFMVVSSSKQANEVTERIEKFLSDFRKNLSENITNEMIQQNKISLAKHKLHMFNSMDEECSHFWSEIVEFRYDWEYHRIEAEYLKLIRKDDVVESFDKWLAPGGGRRYVVVQVIGGEEDRNGSGENGNENHQQKISEMIDLNVDALIEDKRGTCFETW